MAGSSSRRSERRLEAAIEAHVFGGGQKVSRAAVGYVRVSTHEQAEMGKSLPVQKERIKSYCELYGFDLISIEEDAGISGEYYDKRPGIQEALRKCREHHAVLVAYSLSRISRSLRDILFISEELVAGNGDMACISESFDTSTASGRMVFKIFGVLAEFERELIAERTRSVLASKRNEFQKISRFSPYGWKPDPDANGNLVPDDEEQAMRNRIIGMISAGMHPRRICSKLNAEGRLFRGVHNWRKRQVYRIIQHALNLGELTYADFSKVTS